MAGSLYLYLVSDLGKSTKRLEIFGSVIVLASLLIASITNTQNLSTPIFPTLSGKNLNGKEFNLPRDLPAEKTLVLIAFEQEQQFVLDSWAKGLDLPNSPIPWIEVPVISTPYVIGSFIIDFGMRRGITSPKIRDRVITLYTDREAFAKSMGFKYDKQEAYVAVVDRSGKNLGMVKGSFDERKAKTILDLLEPK